MTTNGPVSPQCGDVVIARDVDNGNLYTVTVVPGRPQVRYPTLEKAVAGGAEWVAREGVVMWLTKDGKTFTALTPAHHAPPASGRPRTPKGQR